MDKNNHKKIVSINRKKVVKSYRYGDTLELTTSSGQHIQTIQVLPNKRYVVLDTGEIKEMNVDAENRADNLKSVQSTMRKLRRLITHNFPGGNNQLWITLTYAENVTDTKVVYKDFKSFMSKLRKQYQNLEYISVIEPQANGRWHYHILLKSDSYLKIPNESLAVLWGKGFTVTKRIRKSDKIANYLMAYLSNLEIPEEKKQNSKKFVKGGRLYMYPKGLRIYRRSNGIVNPIEETGTKKEILAKNGIKDKPPDFSKYKTHDTPQGQISYTTEYYNGLKGTENESNE